MSGRGNTVFFFKKDKILALFEKSSNIFTDVEENAQVNGKVKLLPKKTGVRPLFTGVNKNFERRKVLESKLLLSYLISKEKEVKSSGNFVEEWVNALSILGKEGTFYFVKTDIKDAFGSVDSKKLIELLDSAVQEPTFFEEFKKNYFDKMNYGMPKKSERKIYCHMAETTIVNKAKFEIYVADCLRTIEAALHPIVMLDKRKVKLASGLPQGCCLSGDLCEFYYSKMTSMFLHDLTRGDNGILLRTVDDFLYMSKAKENAIAFRDRMTRGIHEFNCYINKSKTISNISSQVERIFFNGLILSFTQKAVLINTSVLATVSVRYSMTFNSTGKMGSFITKKLLEISRSRLPYHLISRRYSDLSTLLDNVWRLGIHCGAKINGMISNACDDRGKYNSSVFVSAILCTGKDLHKRIEHARISTKNLSDKVIAIFICSIYCSLTVISCGTRKVLAEKLKNIALNNLKSLKSTSEHEVLLKYFENLLTGNLL